MSSAPKLILISSSPNWRFGINLTIIKYIYSSVRNRLPQFHTIFFCIFESTSFTELAEACVEELTSFAWHFCHRVYFWNTKFLAIVLTVVVSVCVSLFPVVYYLNSVPGHQSCDYEHPELLRWPFSMPKTLQIYFWFNILLVQYLTTWQSFDIGHQTIIFFSPTFVYDDHSLWWPWVQVIFGTTWAPVQVTIQKGNNNNNNNNVGL